MNLCGYLIVENITVHFSLRIYLGIIIIIIQFLSLLDLKTRLKVFIFYKCIHNIDLLILIGIVYNVYTIYQHKQQTLQFPIT